MKSHVCVESPRWQIEQIERVVASRTNGLVRNLQVEVSGDDIVLSGHASNYYTKQLATHAVLETAKGVSLTNDIEVF